MLILTRYTEESFFIGDDIKITLLSAKGGQARVGIEAPKDVIIAREEIRKQKKQRELPQQQGESS